MKHGLLSAAMVCLLASGGIEAMDLSAGEEQAEAIELQDPSIPVGDECLLDRLPSDVMGEILKYCDPQDVIHVGQTDRRRHQLVHGELNKSMRPQAQEQLAKLCELAKLKRVYRISELKSLRWWQLGQGEKDALLWHAINQGDEYHAVVRFLLDAGAQPYDNLLIKYHGNKKTLKMLLAHPSTRVNNFSKPGFNFLHLAAANGWEDVVELLLQHPKIDVDVRSDWEFNGVRQTKTAAESAEEHALIYEQLGQHDKAASCRNIVQMIKVYKETHPPVPLIERCKKQLDNAKWRAISAWESVKKHLGYEA